MNIKQRLINWWRTAVAITVLVLVFAAAGGLIFGVWWLERVRFVF